MSLKRLSLFMVVVLGLVVSLAQFSSSYTGMLGKGGDVAPIATPLPFPDAYKFGPPPALDVPQSKPQPNHLTHPCGGLAPEPVFAGISPLTIAYIPGMCSSGYGDITVWQANGHDYVGVARFGGAGFHIFNVDDPYNPVGRTFSVPGGGSATLTIFAFKQGTNRYLSLSTRGSGLACGFFVYNVNDPTSPTLVTRKTGSDWCTVHEHFVSTDANGNADYAWLAMSAEGGSGYKMVVLDLSNISSPTETGRYQRPDASGGIFVHDITVFGNRVFLAHWGGGVIIHDKQTLAHNINPTPINPIDSIRPSNFNVHHMWQTTDGNHLFIEDEFINASNAEKIKVYNISNPAAPFYETGIIGSGQAATSQAHNLKIQNVSPGHDRLYVAWYKAGTRGFEVDTTGPNVVITETIKHELRTTAGPGFGGAWGVDYLPCTLRGQPHTCIYTADYEKFGVAVDALGEDPSLDPYKPESLVSAPDVRKDSIINSCSYAIQGAAHDYYGGVQRVEVSVDGGTTWQTAQGTANWTYQWNIASDGSYTIKSRAVDSAGNIQDDSAGIAVVVAGNCNAELKPSTNK